MKQLFINSPARIHFGFLELNLKADRVFGSVGLTISKYKTKIQFKSSKKFQVYSLCDETKKAIENLITKLSKYYKLKPCEINVLDSIPRHSGLGSGTQLALIIGKGLTEFSKNKFEIETICEILGRGNRSGIGIESFRNGGFIVDAGKKKNTKIPPIIFNQKWPKPWKLLLVSDMKSKGIHGKKEIQEFKRISSTNKNNSLSNYKTLLSEILPSLIEKDFLTFCLGIQKIQDNTAKVFSNSQGGKYVSKNIEKIFNELEKNKLFGYGQSSWGPTGFIICENSVYQNKIINLVENFIKKENIVGVKIEEAQAQNYGHNLIR